MPPKDPKEQLAFTRKLRREQTPYERALWNMLRDKQLSGLHFRRQHAIGPYVADFACFKARLIVELDGNSHDERIEKDAVRDAYLAQQGWLVLRFPNVMVRDHLDGVWQTIESELKRDVLKEQEGEEHQER